MTESDLLANQAERFVATLKGLISSVLDIRPEFDVALVGDGKTISIRHSDFRNAEMPGFPLVRQCDDAARPVLLLRAWFRVEMDSEQKYLQVATSSIGLWVEASGGRRNPRPFVRVEYDRNRSTAAAHVQLHANSPELAWVYGSGGAGAPDLHKLHFPLGGRRFRLSLEEFLLFLNEEQIFTDWKPGWRHALNQSLDEWRTIQARATARRFPQDVAAALTDMGYAIRPPRLNVS